MKFIKFEILLINSVYFPFFNHKKKQKNNLKFKKNFFLGFFS